MGIVSIIDKINLSIKNHKVSIKNLEYLKAKIKKYPELFTHTDNKPAKALLEIGISNPGRIFLGSALAELIGVSRGSINYYLKQDINWKKNEGSFGWSYVLTTKEETK